MKGPSLQYDLRVLRIFCCDGCGRQVQSPGHLTTHTCACSHPPRFMRPLERPVTVSPDITAFLSPPDPADLIEDNLPDEEPYVPYIPNLPPRPVRFPGRRKLTDDIERFQPTEFGTGVEPPTASASNEIPNFTPQSVISNVSPATQEPPRRSNRADLGNRPDRSERPDRRESRRERGRRGVRSGEPDDTSLLTEQPVITLDVSAAGPVEIHTDQNPTASESVDKTEASGETDAVASDQSTKAGADAEPRRRHRGRGRRKGRGQGSGGGEA